MITTLRLIDFSHWQRHVAEVYQAECCDHCRSASCGDFFVGCPPSDDLKSAKYQLVIQPYVTAHDVGSHIHALERAPKPILKQHNSYIPVRRSEEHTSELQSLRHLV